MCHPKGDRRLRGFQEYSQIEWSTTSLKHLLECDGLGESAWKTVKEKRLTMLIEPLSDQSENQLIRRQGALADDAIGFPTHQSIQLGFASEDGTR